MENFDKVFETFVLSSSVKIQFYHTGKSTERRFLIDDQESNSHFEITGYIIQCRAIFGFSVIQYP